MDTYEQHTVTRVRSLLHLVFISRSLPSELYSWCQIAFPGCCYLSCATLTAENSFATTSNLAARGSLQVILQPAQEGQATHGAVLHNSWPLQYPDLQQLRESSHWDSVIISGIPQVPVAGASATSTTPHTNGLAVSPTSSQESLMDAQAESHSPNFEVADQAAAPDVEAQSMLILGLRGQNHDLERTLNTMQLLSHQLSPVMHSFRQQLIDQALHAANTAATAADDGDGASLGNSNADLATAQQGALAHLPSTAAAAVTALTSPTADPTPNVVASPFANSEEAVAMGQFGAVERQGRRQEISGSMPLEQMLSRLPSPIGSAAALERASSDGATSSRHASRLGSSLDLGQLASSAQTQPPTPAPDSAVDPTAAHHTQDRWSLDSFGQRTMHQRVSRLGSIENSREGLAPEHSQLPAAHPQAVNFPPQEPGRTQIDDAAGVVPTVSQGQAGHPFRTGYSARGLPLASGSARHSITQLISDTALPSVHHEGGSASQPSHTVRPAATDPGSSLAGEPSSLGPTPQREAVDQGAVNMGGKTVTCGPAEDDMLLVAQLEAEAEARIKEQQRQHPWLLYFYDREMERDYSRYHARQMAMVDFFGWGIAVIVYLRLGFSSGHGYASRKPVTYAVTLGLQVACLFATFFMQDRVRFVREQVVRTVGFVYLAVQMLGTTPPVLQSASIAQIHALPFLARYSNTSTLVTTSLAFVVRLHIHLPCQLVSFVMSAAVLPKAICRAGFSEYSSWKCIAVGVSAQFWIGVVLSTGIVAWNERRLRGMYIRSIAARSVAATKAKAS